MLDREKNVCKICTCKFQIFVRFMQFLQVIKLIFKIVTVFEIWNLQIGERVDEFGF